MSTDTIGNESASGILKVENVETGNTITVQQVYASISADDKLEDFNAEIGQVAGVSLANFQGPPLRRSDYLKILGFVAVAAVYIAVVFNLISHDLAKNSDGLSPQFIAKYKPTANKN